VLLPHTDVEAPGALAVAEGIEQERQLGPLRSLGITAGQGYDLGRPGRLDPGPQAGDSRWA